MLITVSKANDLMVFFELQTIAEGPYGWSNLTVTTITTPFGPFSWSILLVKSFLLHAQRMSEAKVP